MCSQRVIHLHRAHQHLIITRERTLGHKLVVHGARAGCCCVDDLIVRTAGLTSFYLSEKLNELVRLLCLRFFTTRSIGRFRILLLRVLSLLVYQRDTAGVAGPSCLSGCAPTDEDAGRAGRGRHGQELGGRRRWRRHRALRLGAVRDLLLLRLRTLLLTPAVAIRAALVALIRASPSLLFDLV